MATICEQQKYIKSSPAPKPDFEYETAFSFFALFLTDTMNYWFLITIPLLSAFIGWVVNRLARRLLFHPLDPRKILGITFQGVFPKRQQQFAEKLGKLVSTELFSFDGMEEKISNPENMKKIMPLIEDHIDDFLRNRLGKEMPMVGMFIGDKTIGKLKESFMKEIELLFPQVMKQYASNLKEEIDLEQIVVKKIAGFSSNRLEEVLLKVMSREFRLLEIVGAVTGFIIGLILVLITQLIA